MTAGVWFHRCCLVYSIKIFSIHNRRIAPADFLKLAAVDDEMDGGFDLKIMDGEFLADFGEQGFVGKLHGATEGVAEKFACELAQEDVPAGGHQILAQSLQTFDFRAVLDFGLGVDRAVREIDRATATDGVEAFKGEAKGVDPIVAMRAAFVGTVFLSELAHGQGVGGFLLRQTRNVLGRAGEFVTQEGFGDPVAAQDWAGARGTGLFRQRGGLPEDAAASVRLEAVDAPLLFATHAGNAVMIGEGFVEESVDGIEDVPE